MSENNTATADVQAGCCSAAWKLTLALLLLRLGIGWHFFSEGTKKLSYDEGRQEWAITVPTEVVFRNATGPFASFYKNQLPGFYDWENLLAVPVKSEELTGDEISERRDWQKKYASRRKQAEKDGEPLPIEIPDYSAYKAWAENIVSGLSKKLERFVKLKGLSDEQKAEAAELFVARHQQLVDFLESESESIVEYQHELWRLEQLQKQGGADDIPFRKERVTDKKSETNGLGGRLVSEVRGIERGFNNDLRNVLTKEQRSKASTVKKVENILVDPKQQRLDKMNLAVTCLIIGVGVCMLLGLFTRVAAVGGIVFLLSVLVTQLPLVAGAKSDLFFYQLVEILAFGVLLVCGPWRLPSLDGLLRGLGASNAEQRGN